MSHESLLRRPRLRLAVPVILLAALGWPSAGGLAAQAPAPGLQLLLRVNQPFLGTGATLRVDIGAVNAGGAVAADFLWGLILPGGGQVFQVTGGGLAPGTLANLASLHPFLAGVTVPGNFAQTVPDFFAYTFQGFEPLGRYTVYFAATRPGSLRDGRIDGGDLLALETRTFDVGPPVSTLPETAGAVTVTMSPDLGGTLAATATNGVRYTLDVPAGVLRAPTAITLTPASAGSLPVTGGVVAALRAGPAGLHFDGPVSLTIEVPGGVPDGTLLVLVAPEDGGGAEVLFGQKVGPTTLEVRGITHFSQFVVSTGLAGGLPSLASPTGLEFKLQVRVLTDAIRLGLLTEAEFLVAFRDNLLAWEAFVDGLLASGEQATTLAGRERALVDAMVSFDHWDRERLIMLGLTAAPAGDPTRPQWVTFNAEAKAHGIATRARLGRLARAHMLAFDALCRATRSVAAAEDELRAVVRNDAYMDTLEEQASPERDTLPPVPLDDYRALGRAFPTRAEFCVRTDILDVTSSAIEAANPVTITGRAGVVFDQDTSPTFRSDVEVTIDGAPPAAQVRFTAPDGAFSATLTPNRPDPVFFVDAALIPGGSAVPGAWRRLGDSRQLPESVLAITPSQVTLQPGATQAFIATIDGQPVAATTIIWSATGGTITPLALFTAGNAAGAFFVTATDSLNSSVVAVAQVTIGSPTLNGNRSLEASVTGFACSDADIVPSAPVTASVLTASAACGGFSNVITAASRVDGIDWTATVTPFIPEVHAGTGANGGGSWQFVPGRAGTLEVSVSPGAVGSYFVLASVSYRGSSAQARYLLNTNEQVVNDVRTASLAIVPSGDSAVTVSLTFSCSDVCATSGPIASAVFR